MVTTAEQMIRDAYARVIEGLDEIQVGVIWGALLRNRLPTDPHLRDRAQLLERLRDAIGRESARRADEKRAG